VKRTRRKVYRQTPVSTCDRIAELDHRMSYADMTAALAHSKLGVLSGGTALALWRACHERGLRAWCYEFGFPHSLTHTVTIVEIDEMLHVHDAFFNLSYPLALDDMLESLRSGNAITGEREVRDRKIYIADPAREPDQTVRWLESHADDELEPVDGLRRFELLWSPEAFAATHPSIPAVSSDLAARGYPGDLQFLMLHPVAVFDGEREHRDRSSMPLVGGRDLRSPVAELRVAMRDLAAERTNGAKLIGSIARLEAELADANSRAARLAASRNEMDEASTAERELWLQQKVALQAQKNALEGELVQTRQRLSATTDLRAQRDSQIAQLRAEIEDTRQQFEVQRETIAELEAENHGLVVQLDESRRRAESLEIEVSVAQTHAIEVSHHVAPLIDELSTLRQSLAAERTRAIDAERQVTALEARIAASLSARLIARWRRSSAKRGFFFRAARRRSHPRKGVKN
jgi:predicted  nucleic acid-binding Zn-ribbon protein